MIEMSVTQNALWGVIQGLIVTVVAGLPISVLMTAAHSWWGYSNG